MTNFEKICIKQQNIYILNEIIKKSGKIYIKIGSSVKKPIAPREPVGGSYQIFPDYNAEEYRKKAKAAGSGLGEFRKNCLMATCALAQSLIGLIICWIPLVLIILSLPFSIGHTRRVAYKMYIKDCKEIERKNETNKYEIEAYNRASVKYRNDLIKYEEHTKNLESKQTAFCKEIDKAKAALIKLNAEYVALCEDAKIPPAYQNFIEIHMICGYLKTKNAFSVDEAIRLFQEQARNGKLNSNLEYIENHRSLFVNSMPEVIKALVKCNSSVSNIENDLYERAAQVTNENIDIGDTLLNKFILNSVS